MSFFGIKLMSILKKAKRKSLLRRYNQIQKNIAERDKKIEEKREEIRKLEEQKKNTEDEYEIEYLDEKIFDLEDQIDYLWDDNVENRVFFEGDAYKYFD